MIPIWRKNYQRYRSYFSHLIAQYKNRDDAIAYIEIMLSLVTISIFSLFALRPTLITIAQLLKEIEANNQTIAAMDKKIQNITRAQTLYDKERSKIMMVFESVPTGASPETIIRQIEGISEKHKVAISQISIGKATILGANASIASNASKGIQVSFPQSPNQDIFYSEVSVAANVPLDAYPLIQKFLHDIEKQRIPLIITQVNIANVKEKERRSLVLNMKFYLPYTENKNVD